MTLEELQKKLDQQQAENEKLAKQVKDQNAYITRLEADKSKGGTTGVDPTVQNYLKKKMREDALNESKAEIVSVVGADVYAAIEPDLIPFLDKHMTETHTNKAYIIDAFNLLLGRAYGNKDHAIHKIGKDGKQQETSQQASNAGSNASTVAGVQNKLASQGPSPINDQDQGGGQTGVQADPVKNTKEAKQRLRDRMRQQMAGNRFN